MIWGEITACGELFGMNSKGVEDEMKDRKYDIPKFVKQLKHV
jgi:hypothetical protein